MGGNYARYIGIGFAFVAVIAALAAGGFFVDGLVGTLPLFTILGLVAGFAGALYYVYLAVKGLGGR
ncbi:AtpZ/AtpI family protein [Rubrobacter calidifluminis]|uniref:AtpZ/AtpI family protein n=1 Tax=Rubrobacter calidifluminis TaxID=1392640 RepID=UPI00236077AF|nr:AtpZ/AtpI family protein [Rubrobacter calidifluminis]